MENKQKANKPVSSGQNQNKGMQSGGQSQNKGMQGGGKKGGQKQKLSKKALIFFGVMVIVYIILYFVYPEKTLNALKYVFKIIKEILPILLFVYLFMVGFALLNENKIKASIGNAPMAVKYILMSILGTLSHGTIYAWYPFLKDLNDKGLSKGTVGTFLYARGIKLALLPMLASFFGLKYVVILTIVTLLFSIVEGLIIDATSKE